MSARPALLSPQEQPRERRLYRPVWRTASVEITILLIIVAAIVLAARFIHITPGNTQRTVIGLALALLPVGLWFGVSYRAEQRARQPRPKLVIVLLMSMLVANAIGVPLVDRLFAVDSWLPNADALKRILGYALTAGFSAEFLKLAVLRFTVWPECFKTRIDGIAYSVVAAIGYAAVLNLNFVLSEPAEPAAVALRVAGVTLTQVASGTIVGFWLAELKLTRPAVFWLPVSLGLAALLEGTYVGLRAGVIVGTFSDKATGSLPAASLGVAITLVIALFSSISFLIRSANERARRSPEFIR